MTRRAFFRAVLTAPLAVPAAWRVVSTPRAVFRWPIRLWSVKGTQANPFRWPRG